MLQAVQFLPVVEDFFQKEKDRWYSVSSPFLFFFNTLSDRLALMALLFFSYRFDAWFAALDIEKIKSK